MRPARYDDVRAFCRVDGWSRKADAPGRFTHKHEVWAKALADGTSLRCVISKGRGEYSPQMMRWIIKHELRATEQEFWAAVRDGVAPARPQAQPARPQRELLPLSLVRALQAAGHTPNDLRGLTLEEAKHLLKPK
jgi:hypothetical protein